MTLVAIYAENFCLRRGVMSSSGSQIIASIQGEGRMKNAQGVREFTVDYAVALNANAMHCTASNSLECCRRCDHNFSRQPMQPHISGQKKQNVRFAD